jgi:hypothetical protein
MTQEFIPYEQALELKELGFDEPCFGTYLSSFQSDWKVYELILEMGMNEEFEDNRNVYLLEGACSAPTYSQAFRWFREKYELTSEVCVEQYRRKTNKKWMFSITYLNEDAMYEHSKTTFENYEEAELACLNKLIEIIENQKQK